MRRSPRLHHTIAAVALILGLVLVPLPGRALAQVNSGNTYESGGWSAGGLVSGGNPLQQFQQIIATINQVRQQITAWIWQIQGLISSATGLANSANWSSFGSQWGQTPDFLYGASQIAQQLQGLAQSLQGLPGQASQWLNGIAQRLLQAPAPARGSPEDSATRQAQSDPEFAARAHAVQQDQVAAISTQADAQTAAALSQQVAQQVTSDTTPDDTAQASSQIAQQTADAVQNAPSTRAVVEIMASALAQQQALAMAQQAAIAARLDALITQNAQTASAISSAVSGIATVSDLFSQHMTQALDAEARGNVTTQDAMAGATGGIAGELQFLASGDQSGLDRFLATPIGGP